MLDPGFYNMDCMEGMKQFPDGFFDLAIVDPPYGDGGQNIGGGVASADCSTGTRWNRFGQRFDRYKYQNQAGGYHGKWPDAVEPGEPGRRSSAKKSLRGT